MVTAAALLRMSMQDLGVLGAGESGAGEHLSDGLRRLQMMLGGWGLDALTAARTQGEYFPTIPGQQHYSIGPGMELDTPRPVGQQSVVAAGLVLNAGQPNAVEIPRAMMTYDQYISIRVKTLQSPLFTHVLYVPGATGPGPNPTPPPGTHTFGVSHITLWPVPTEANPLVLYIERMVPMFENLTTAYPVPDGLTAAIQYNLTVALAPMFQVEPPAEVVRQARLSYAAMKRTNYQMTDIAIDPMFTFGQGAAYDITTGSTRR
jgi:hypothetical protein